MAVMAPEHTYTPSQCQILTFVFFLFSLRLMFDSFNGGI